MNTAGSNDKSLIAYPAAASNQADEHPTDDETIDLTALDAVRPARPRHPASPESRRSLWLTVRPVVTESTRPLPPGLFSLTTRSR
jgi:hypothetical protein